MTEQSAKPSMPDRIEVIAHVRGERPRFELLIDGIEFPWFVAGVALAPDPDAWPEVIVRIPARSVTSTHNLDCDDR